MRQRAKILYQWLLSEDMKHRSEKVIIKIAVGSFLLHLLLIFLIDFQIISLQEVPKFLINPISAIYTPFSFILIYEVYLLIHALPKSHTYYIGKQYEIITLILIRRIFKDLSKLELSTNWFELKSDLQFTYDIAAVILLFLSIFLFYWLNSQRSVQNIEQEPLSPEIQRYIRIKKIVGVAMVLLLIGLACISLYRWLYANFSSFPQLLDSIKDINDVFFGEFFTILILVDVLLLLLSFLHTDQFHTIMRNSGFLISTILIRLSFGTEGILNPLLILGGVLFGVIILAIHNRYEGLVKPMV